MGILLFIHNYTQVQEEVATLISIEDALKAAEWDLYENHDYPEAFDIIALM